MSVYPSAAVGPTEWDGDLSGLRFARARAEDTQPTATVGVKDRGKSYWRQVAETVWVAAAFCAGMWLGAMMGGVR